ncbi:hypothetical protein AB3N62_11330 [Leptospira sp. WS4.C2]
MKNLNFFLISMLSIHCISGCSGKPNNINQHQHCNAEIKNYSEIDKPDKFVSFIHIIKNKDCVELIKWLSDDFFYSLDELTVYIPFYKKYRYNNGTDICDFFYNQDAFQSVIYEETSINHVISPYSIIQNANKISLYGTPNIDSKPYEVTLEVSTCINGTPDTGLPTLFTFDCYSKPISKCNFRGVYSWTRITNKK